MKKILLLFFIFITILFSDSVQTQLENNKITLETAHYYGEVCNRNKSVACYNLGVIYIDGRGVKQDKKRGEKILCIACKKGAVITCDELNMDWTTTSLECE